MDAVLPYRAMAYNNGWANHRLLAACAKLSQADFVAPRSGFFPSLRATLNHILIIDRFYVDAMEGGTLGPAAWANQEPCETAIVLRAAQGEMDRRLIAVVEHLGPADLERVVNVHRGVARTAFLQGIKKCAWLNELGARDVDEQRGRLHPREILRADDAFCLGTQPNAQ